MIIVHVIRKPIIESLILTTIEHHTGALNIDLCRVHVPNSKEHEGRYPSNVVIVGNTTVESMDTQSGVLKSGTGAIKKTSSKSRLGNQGSAYGAESRPAGTVMICYGDEGGASRFFRIFQNEKL